MEVKRWLGKVDLTEWVLNLDEVLDDHFWKRLADTCTELIRVGLESGLVFVPALGLEPDADPLIMEIRFDFSDSDNNVAYRFNLKEALMDEAEHAEAQNIRSLADALESLSKELRTRIK